MVNLRKWTVKAITEKCDLVLCCYFLQILYIYTPHYVSSDKWIIIWWEKQDRISSDKLNSQVCPWGFQVPCRYKINQLALYMYHSPWKANYFQLWKNILSFYGTKRSITVFIKACLNYYWRVKLNTLSLNNTNT